jgi:hypothetical protein
MVPTWDSVVIFDPSQLMIPLAIAFVCAFNPKLKKVIAKKAVIVLVFILFFLMLF